MVGGCCQVVSARSLRCRWGWWAPKGYYVGKKYRTFNFTGANLVQKYGNDPAFAAGLLKEMKNKQSRSANDPWCIGFFVDNEHNWGDEVTLALAT